jgi:hypothetical protein
MGQLSNALFMLFCVVFVVGATAHADKQFTTLMSMFSDESRKDLGWICDKEMCDYCTEWNSTIVCDANGTVNAIVVEGWPVTGTLPPSFAGLHGLTILRLSSNDLSGTLPDVCDPATPHLRNVRLDHNLFTGTIPNCQANQSALVYYDISGNNLEGTLPASFADPQSAIHALYVSGSGLSGALPHGLPTPYMTRLDVSFNAFTGHPPGCGNLTELFIDHNDFSGLVPWCKGARIRASHNTWTCPLPPHPWDDEGITECAAPPAAIVWFRTIYLLYGVGMILVAAVYCQGFNESHGGATNTAYDNSGETAIATFGGDGTPSRSPRQSLLSSVQFNRRASSSVLHFGGTCESPIPSEKEPKSAAGDPLDSLLPKGSILR